jgi:hypothetical protein
VSKAPLSQRLHFLLDARSSVTVCQLEYDAAKKHCYKDLRLLTKVTCAS